MLLFRRPVTANHTTYFPTFPVSHTNDAAAVHTARHKLTRKARRTSVTARTASSQCPSSSDDSDDPQPTYSDVGARRAHKNNALTQLHESLCAQLFPAPRLSHENHYTPLRGGHNFMRALAVISTEGLRAVVIYVS